MPCARSFRQFQDHWIVGIDNRPVAFLLVLKDPSFRRGVSLERRVTIEVVRRHVEQHRDPWPKGHDGLELKAARFDNVQRVRRRALDLRTQR